MEGYGVDLDNLIITVFCKINDVMKIPYLR